jgi:hypothetical protein
MQEKAYFDLPLLGELFIDEVFISYIEPQVFTCGDRLNTIYLVVASDRECEKAWIASTISEYTLFLLKKNKIDLYTALTNYENLSHYFYEFVKQYDGYVCVLITDVHTIEKERLPKPGYFLNI